MGATTNDDPPWRLMTTPATASVPARADVAVVGAGIAGLLTARGLALAGARVAILDPLDPRRCSARRQPGLVHAGLAEHPSRLLASLGGPRAGELFSLFRRSLAALGSLAMPVEQRWLATAPGEDALLSDSVDALRSLGWPAEREKDSLSVPGDGLVHPEQAWLSLLQDALAAGASLHRSTVLSTPDDPCGVRVETTEGTLCAEVVVYACGVGARRLDGFFVDTLWPVRESASCYPLTLPLCSGRAGHGWTWFRPSPERSDEALVGGCRWASAHLELGETEIVVPEAIAARHDAFVREHLHSTAPALSRWAWIETHSCDGLPIVGPLPGDVRRIACVGFAGSGWSLAPACAALVVEGLVGSCGGSALLSPSRLS